jgi:regulatory protein
VDIDVSLRLSQDSNMMRKAREHKKLAREELFQYAASLLAARSLSTAEVRTRLVRKAADPVDVGQVLARLRDYKFLDDSRFAEGYASARRDSGSFGQARVLRDLRQRRVPGPVAESAVDAAFEDFDERGAVDAWLRRKFRNTDLRQYLQEPKHLSSVFRKLRYAGFSSSASIAALKSYASRADELEDEPLDEG